MTPTALPPSQGPDLREISAREATTLPLPQTVALHALSGHAITGRLVSTAVTMSSPAHIAAIDLSVELDLAPPHFTAICTLPVNPDYPITLLPTPSSI